MASAGRFLYSVYGLTVASEVELPELATGYGEPDIVITLSPERVRVPDPKGIPSFHGAAQDVTLEYPQVASLNMLGGREIRVERRAGVDSLAVRDVLLGPALAVLLHQRGVLALHASSVLCPRGVVGFVGNSGWGKSTMAGALERRGHELVADDVTAVEPTPEMIGVLPAFPRLKLWPEAAEALGLEPESLPRVVASEAKRAQAVARSLPAGRLPLIALFVLAEGAPVRIEPLSPRDALIELVRHSFCAKRLVELGSEGHFLQCAEVARRVPVRRLLRPRDLGRLAAVADLVENELASAS